MAMVRDAAAAGRITDLDRDRRLQELEHAGSLDEIEIHVRDLRLPADPHTAAPWHGSWAPPADAAGPAHAGPAHAGPARPGHTPASPGAQAHGELGTGAGGSGRPASGAPTVGGAPDGASFGSGAQASAPPGWQPTPGTPTGGPAYQMLRVPPRPPAAVPQFQLRRGSRPGCLVGALVALLALAFLLPLAGTIGFFATFDGASESEQFVEDTGPALLTRSGWDDMVAAIEAETDGRVTMLMVYDNYASVMVPRGDRAKPFHYDGKLLGMNEVTTTDQAFALREVDFAVVRKVLRRAARGVEGQRSRHVLVRQGVTESEPTLWAYVFGRSGTQSVQARLDGTILRCNC